MRRLQPFLGEQVKRKDIRPVESVEDMAQAGVFESDEELEQFHVDEPAHAIGLGVQEHVVVSGRSLPVPAAADAGEEHAGNL
jgi:hypothetical protein